MRQRRTELASRPGRQTILLANRMRPGVQVMNFEDRAMLRSFVQQAAKQESFELLAWCYLPTSFHIVVRGSLTPDFKIDKSSPSDVQAYPLSRFAKRLFTRFGHWRNFRKVESQIWQERYQSAPLTTSGEHLAGAISVDLAPVLFGLADQACDYYFCSFHDACAGDEQARYGIAQLINRPDATWSKVHKEYRRLLENAHARVNELDA